MLISPGSLFIAAIGGAAIGFERQWSGHASGPRARFGGIRTFTLLGGLGGIAGGLAAAGWMALATALLACGGALVIIGYAAKSREDVDATTEVAALVVLGAGMLSGAGMATVASGIIAATTVLLLEKTRLHTLATKVDDVALFASARFAALAFVVLPLLPGGSYGPFGAIRPREVWALVLFFSGLSFTGWIARRLLGPTRGVIVTGLLGGLVSSTSVTLSFARASRRANGGAALAVGTVGACTLMLVRVFVASAVLNPRLMGVLLPFIWLSLLVGVVILLVALRRQPVQRADEPNTDGSPLQMGSALQMAALFQGVLLVIGAVTTWWSVRALMVTSALVGLTDLDALTLSLARSADVLPDSAARGLAVGIVANTLLKMSIAGVVGRGVYRVIVTVSLGVMAASVAAALWFW